MVCQRVIAYACRHINDKEKNYIAKEKDCLAIIFRIQKMRPHVKSFILRFWTTIYR